MTPKGRSVAGAAAPRLRLICAREIRRRPAPANAFDAAWLAWRAGIPDRIGYARDGRRLLLTNAIAVPKPGEIPAHEKFYYLELLRRAGWIDQLQDDVHIALHVPEARRVKAAETLLEAGARATYGARCDRRGRFLRLGKVLAARALRTMGQSFSGGNGWRRNCSHGGGSQRFQCHHRGHEEKAH